MGSGSKSNFLDAVNSKAGLKGVPGDPGALISAILPYIFGIAGILLLVYLVLGGFQLMTSRGDPKAVAGAWAKITNAVIGFVIVFVSFLLVRLIGQILGITAFSALFK